MIEEIWKPIDGFAGYEVSNLGQVRRGTHIKKLKSDRKGYLSVTLWGKNKRTKIQVSRLVAAAFIGPRPGGQIVRHRNGVNTLNHASNLRYGTYRENEGDKIEHGTKLEGERHPAAILTAKQVAEIRRRYVPYSRTAGAKALGKEYGVTGSTIHYALSGKNWKCVPT